jgi:hypothetical protein
MVHQGHVGYGNEASTLENHKGESFVVFLPRFGTSKASSLVLPRWLVAGAHSYSVKA